MKKSMEKISNLINTNLAGRLHQLDGLSTEVMQFFSISGENRLWPLLRHGRLTLMTDDPHLATQIRFQQNTLCKHLSKRLNLKISGLNIRLISLPLASFEQKKNRLKLSDDAAQVMRSIASSIDDPELQLTMMRLTTTISQQRP